MSLILTQIHSCCDFRPLLSLIPDRSRYTLMTSFVLQVAEFALADGSILQQEAIPSFTWSLASSFPSSAGLFMPSSDSSTGECLATESTGLGSSAEEAFSVLYMGPKLVARHLLGWGASVSAIPTDVITLCDLEYSFYREKVRGLGGQARASIMPRENLVTEGVARENWEGLTFEWQWFCNQRHIEMNFSTKFELKQLWY
jgi:hypothetical protein